MRKKYPITVKLMSFLLILTILISGCSSTTYIQSYPSGADVYLNGEAVGQTPYAMTDTKPIFSCTSIRLEKEDHLPYRTTICRDEEADVGALIGGFFFFIPFFWGLKYKPSRTYSLIPVEGSSISNEKAIHSEECKNKEGFDKLIDDELD